MTTKSHAISIIIIALVLAFHVHAAYANTDDVIIGKVVSVADGDTITVLENLTKYRIRLFGIDAPERRQDFSNRAKQFVSELVFGNQVRVVKKDVDRYGRIVGIVYVGVVCVNEELVRNGLAWVSGTGTIVKYRFVLDGWNCRPRLGRESWVCGHTLIRCRHGNIG